MAKLKSDVFISGGGPVGLMLAIGLANQGKTVTLAERFLPELSYSSDLNKVKNSFDGRVLALSKGSQTCLQDLEIWSQLEPFTTPIEHIHVSQKGYLGITTLHADEVDVDALGFSVQSSYLGKVLWDIASQKENIRLLAPAQLHSFVESKNHVDIKVKEQDDSITKIKAQLIVGADGTQSKVREILGLEIKEKSYDAYGVLAKIETEQHPQGWAYERFTSEGPVALLPMQGHAHKAVLVCSDQQVEKIKSLDDAEYLELFASKMGER
ncbi:MAG TPA: ubiquinone biosynthesis protein, partial [Thiomicrospira sp.]|nr:ubiquinone biosynthesis protein [Thiomicrospira sp.]